jgi:hypothetical protein
VGGTCVSLIFAQRKFVPHHCLRSLLQSLIDQLYQLYVQQSLRRSDLGWPRLFASVEDGVCSAHFSSCRLDLTRCLVVLALDYKVKDFFDHVDHQRKTTIWLCTWWTRRCYLCCGLQNPVRQSLSGEDRHTPTRGATPTAYFHSVELHGL